MAVRPLSLAPGILLSAAPAVVIYPATASIQLTTATFTNTDSAPHTITVYLVRSGGAPGDLNTIISSQVLAPNVSWTAPQMSGRNLSAGDSIMAFADADAVVNVIIDGFSY